MSKILKRVLIVALLLLLVFGCAGSSKKTKPAGQPVPSNQMDESFDPLTLHDEDLVIEGEKTTATEPLHPAEVTLPEEKNVPENKLVDGFRIQIISTKSLENATRAKQIASEQFSDLNLRFYLDFDSPYYKVRMGDFQTREEAQKIRDIVRLRGYPKAWTVPARVWSHPEIAAPPDSLSKIPEPEN